MSVEFRVRDAIEWIGGELLRGNGDRLLSGATIDSRAVGAGELFVAIVGPKHDAHGFLSGAAESGAGGLLIEGGRELPAALAADLPVVAVDDTTLGLGRLARGHRSGFTGPVVAITGSNGKTTTKEMCAAILSVAAPCGRTLGNLNNHYGLPLTLLRREADDASLVVEMGMNHRGEIAELVAIAQPTVGLITNIGTAHIEYLGSREEIALEKGDLVAGLSSDATAVLNADDPLVAAQAERTSASVLRFGCDPDVEVCAENPVRNGDSCWKFDLATPSGRVSVEISGLGETTWRNALAAGAGAFAAGASPDQIAEGLGRYRGVSGRLEHSMLASGAMVIDDSYNANPQSMEMALRLLVDLSADGRSFAAIGDMGELGDAAPEAHRRVGAVAAELGIDCLYLLGAHAEEVRAGAIAGGMESQCIEIGSDTESLADRLHERLQRGDHVVVKGSRAMRMERVVRRLAERGTASEATN
jgi:UDP-N-acetylmuramoyl-tripeptide--D-alanyl-D-alanine ligase